MNRRFGYLVLFCLIFNVGSNSLYTNEETTLENESQIIAQFESTPQFENEVVDHIRNSNSINLQANNVVHDGVISGGEYDFTTAISSTYSIHYTVDGSTIYIGLVSTGTGWVALGIDPDPGARMAGADVIIGFYDGATNIRDDHSTGETKHAADTVDNILSSAAGENAGSTTLEFSRLLNTGDAAEDKVITVGVSTDIIWGYHSSNDDFTSKHGSSDLDRQTTSITFQELLPPGAPQSPSAVASPGQVSLSWSVPSSDGGSAITGYNIYRSTSSGGSYSQIGNTASLTYVDTTVTNGFTYYYVVRAVNVKGESPDSTEVNGTPIGGPSPPQNLNGVAGSGQVSLSWEIPISDGGSAITGYTVKRSETDGGPYSTTVGTTTSLNLDDSTVTDGTTYYYIVTAQNVIGSSSNSNQLQATPGSSPSSPQTLLATGGASEVILNWSIPLSDGGSAITQYRIYRSLTGGGPYTNIANSTSISYIDTTAVNGNTYYYVVTAENAIGESGNSNEASATPATVPSVPQSLTASDGNNQVILNWTAPVSDGGSTLTGYKIYRSSSGGGPYSQIGTSVSLNYIDNTALNGNTYYYVVTAENVKGESGNSNEASATPATVPSAPQSLTASDGNNQATLNWTAPISDGGSTITQYRIYRSPSSGGPYTNIANTTSISYVDTTAINGNTYYYVLTAENVKGESGNSNEASATPATVPSAPQSLTASDGNNQVILNWTAPSSDGGSTITQYRVYRSTSSGGSYSQIGTSVSLGYVDNTAVNGNTYYFVVTSENVKGESGNSNEASATPATVPSTPQSLTTTEGDNQVTLNWTAPVSDGGSTITQYRIYRATTSGGPYTNIANTTSISYVDTTAINGNSYYYVVTAENVKGESGNSNEASASPATIPSTPQNLTATEGNNQVILNWTAPASNGGSTITQYRVYRSTTSGGSYSQIGTSVSLGYADNTAVNGNTYYYVVTAENAKGESGNSNEATATPATVPSPPQSLSAAKGNNQVTLNWTAPVSNGGSSITQYRIYRSMTSGGSYTNIANTTGISYIDLSAINGNTYYYVVTAENVKGESGNSNEATATPVTVPDSPQSLTTTEGNNQVILNWTTPVSDGGSPITEYKIYRSTTSGGPYSQIGTSVSLGYVDNTAVNGITYYYVVTSVNIEGESGNSNEASATPATVPSVPQSLVSLKGDNQVILNWTAPVSDGGSVITQYRVYRSTTSGGPYTNIANSTNISYVDNTAVNGNTYYYVVTAENVIGEGSNSNEVNASPATVPSPPQSLTPIEGNNQVILNWTLPASDGGVSIIQYKIYRSTTSGGSYSSIGTSNTLGYLDITAINGITYYYVVTAINAEGESGNSNEASATPATIPSVPQSLTATEGNNQIILNWTTPASNGGSPIIQYRVYRSTTSGGLYINIANVTDISHVDTTAINGNTYYYVISAENVKGESGNSNEVSATPATVPDVPQSLTATKGNNQVTLNWTSPVSDGGSSIFQFRVYRSSISGGPYSNIANTTASSYIDTSVVNGNTYYYVVTAENVKGESGNSNEVNSRPEGPPSAPLNLIGVAGDNNVSLSWSASLNDGGSTITQYRIYRAGVSGGPYTNIANTTGLSYTDVSAINGDTYFYVITAENAIGESSNSNEERVTLAAVPSPPQNLSAVDGNNFVNLTWEVPSDQGGSAILYYNVYRAGISGGPFTFLDNTTSLFYNDTSATNGNTFYYVVAAVNSDGEGLNSNEASGIPSTIPSEPQNLIATEGNSQVSLSWSIPLSDGGSSITQYRIYRSNISGGPYTNIANTTSLGYTDNTVSNGNTYYYVVTTENVNGQSGNSNEVSATPATVPSQPQNLIATPGISQITLNWDIPSDDGGSSITLYMIYRSLTSGSGYTLIANTTGLTYLDSSLNNGVNYYYVVTAINSKGASSNSNEANENPGFVPTKPQNLIASEGSNQVILSWATPSSDGGLSIIEYIIYRSTSSGGSYSQIGTSSTLGFTDNTAINGNTYYYVVTAVNSKGESLNSDEVSATPATVPSVPQSLIATDGNNQVTLNWTAPVTDGGSAISQYGIYRSANSGGPYTNIANVTVLGYVDTTAMNGNTYYYVVIAVNSKGQSGNSNEASANPATVPSVPQSLIATDGNNQVILTWSTPVTDGGSIITIYRIHRSPVSGGPYTEIGNSTILSYTDNTVINGNTYYYVVTAENTKGQSGNSNEASATPATVPSVPQSLTSQKGNNQVTLNWTAPISDGGSTIIQYRIYRSTTSGGPYTNIVNVTGLGYVDTTAVNGNTYYYVVTAENTKGQSGFSNQVSATPATIPSIPQSLTSTEGNNQVLLSWLVPVSDGGSTITQYLIYRSTISGGPYTNIANETGTSHLDTTAVNGIIYYYVVKAENANGESGSSNEVAAIPATLPSVPQSLTSQKGNNLVTLNWTTPASDGGSTIIQYRIYRSTTSGGPYTNIVNVTGLGYVDTTAVNGNTYYYVITAENTKGQSGFSNQVSATPATIPSIPQSLIAIESNNQVILTWSPPVTDGGSIITIYRIHRSSVSGGPYTEIGNSTILSYTDNTAINGNTYYYVVTAENANGESGFSNEASGTPATIPSIPQSLIATEGNNQVTLSWLAPASNGGSTINQYLIYRSTTSGGPYTNIANVTSISYIDMSAVNGITYYYVVTAENVKGQSGFSNQESATPASAPSTPQNFQITGGNNIIILNWTIPVNDGGLGITGYRIYRSTTSGGLYSEIATSSTLSYIDDTVSNGQTYYYVITAFNAKGESLNSIELFETPSTLPSSIQDFNGLGQNNSITITWVIPSTNGGSAIIEYNVYRSNNTGGPYTLIGSVMGLNYTDTDVINGVTYYYTIRAVNINGEGSQSLEINVKPATVPTSPLNLNATSENLKITLNWIIPLSNGGSSIFEYRIYRSLSSNGQYANIANTTGLLYIDFDVVNGITYYYKISAVNQKGEGENSIVIDGTPSTISNPPANLTGVGGNTFAVLSWTHPVDDGGSEIETYNVYRSNETEGLFTLIGSTSELIYNDTNLINGITMYYKVSAVNIKGESGFSAEVAVTPKAPITSTSSSTDTTSSNTPVSLSTSKEDPSDLNNQFIIIGSLIGLVATFGAGIVYARRRRV